MKRSEKIKLNKTKIEVLMVLQINILGSCLQQQLTSTTRPSFFANFETPVQSFVNNMRNHWANHEGENGDEYDDENEGESSGKTLSLSKITREVLGVRSEHGTWFSPSRMKIQFID